MSDINQIIIEGRLVRDPEMKTSTIGMRIAKFSVASNRRTKDGDKPTFIDVTAFAKTADFVGEYCKKGRPVIVVGSVQEDRWQDATTGQQRSKITIAADKVEARGDSKQGERLDDKARASAAPEDDSLPF